MKSINRRGHKGFSKGRKEARALRNCPVGYFSEGARLQGRGFNFVPS